MLMVKCEVAKRAHARSTSSVDQEGSGGFLQAGKGGHMAGNRGLKDLVTHMCVHVHVFM